MRRSGTSSRHAEHVEFVRTSIFGGLPRVRRRSPGAQRPGRARLVKADRAGCTEAAEKRPVERVSYGILVLETQVVDHATAHLASMRPAWEFLVDAPAVYCAGRHLGTSLRIRSR